MRSILLAAAALGASVSSAHAQTISLHPGESVTVRVENGKVIVDHRSAAEPITEFESYVLWRTETQEVPPGVKVVPPGVVVEGEGPPNPPQFTDNRLRLTMRQVPGIRPGSSDNTALFIENGYGSALAYQAEMSGKNRSGATDVCEVAPHLLGLEHWPYVIDELDLSAFQLEPWSGTIECK